MLGAVSPSPNPEQSWGSPRAMWTRRPVGIAISPLDCQRTCKHQLTVPTQKINRNHPPNTCLHSHPGFAVPGPGPAPPESFAAEAGVSCSGRVDRQMVATTGPVVTAPHPPSPGESAGPPHFRNTRDAASCGSEGGALQGPEISGERKPPSPFRLRVLQTRPRSSSLNPARRKSGDFFKK